MSDIRDEQMADPMIRIAALNAAIAIGRSNPRKACELAEKFLDWVVFENLPSPSPGENWH